MFPKDPEKYRKWCETKYNCPGHWLINCRPVDVEKMSDAAIKAAKAGSDLKKLHNEYRENFHFESFDKWVEKKILKANRSSNRS